MLIMVFTVKNYDDDGEMIMMMMMVDSSEVADADRDVGDDDGSDDGDGKYSDQRRLLQ